MIIMMNFIITMISHSYEKINSEKESYNYRERSKMIFEREVRFNETDFLNNILFPKLLVVRKKKQGDIINQEMVDKDLTTVKDFL